MALLHSTSSVSVRILASVMLLLSVLFMPFGVSVVLGLGAMIYFSIFGEAVLLFFLSDLLYGAKEVKFFGVTYVSFIFSIVILIIIELIKKKVRFYPKKQKSRK